MFLSIISLAVKYNNSVFLIKNYDKRLIIDSNLWPGHEKEEDALSGTESLEERKRKNERTKERKNERTKERKKEIP